MEIDNVKFAFLGYCFNITVAMHITFVFAFFITMQFAPHLLNIEVLKEEYATFFPYIAEITKNNVNLAQAKYDINTAQQLFEIRIILQTLSFIAICIYLITLVPYLFLNINFAKKISLPTTIILGLLLSSVGFFMIFFNPDFSLIARNKDIYWLKLDGAGYGTYALFSIVSSILFPMALGFLILKWRMLKKQ